MNIYCTRGLLKKSYGTLPMPCAIGWSSEVAHLLCRWRRRLEERENSSPRRLAAKTCSKSARNAAANRFRFTAAAVRKV